MKYNEIDEKFKFEIPDFGRFSYDSEKERITAEYHGAEIIHNVPKKEWERLKEAPTFENYNRLIECRKRSILHSALPFGHCKIIVKHGEDIPEGE